MGPSKAFWSYSVPSNEHLKILVQILFRGEAEEEVPGKPLFCCSGQFCSAPNLQDPLSKANPLYWLAIVIKLIVPKLTGLKPQYTLIISNGSYGQEFRNGGAVWLWVS